MFKITELNGNLTNINNSILNVVHRSYEDFRSSAQPTGISANGGYYGQTILVIASAQNGAGVATFSEIGMLWCGYDGNNLGYSSMRTNNAGNSSSGSCLTFTCSSSGEIYIQCSAAKIGKVAFVMVG